MVEEEKEKKKTAAEMKEENDAIELEITRSEELQQRLKLGGNSDAGQIEEEKSKEEALQEEAEKFLKEDE